MKTTRKYLLTVWINGYKDNAYLYSNLDSVLSRYREMKEHFLSLKSKHEIHSFRLRIKKYDIPILEVPIL